MAWPFTGVTAPNKDSGFMAVPTGAAAAPTNFDTVSSYWLLGAHFANNTQVDQFVTLTDGADAVIVPARRIPPNDYILVPWEFLPTVGLKWVATGAVTGKVWGYL